MNSKGVELVYERGEFVLITGTLDQSEEQDQMFPLQQEVLPPETQTQDILK